MADTYGNPASQTDEYGNPIHHQTGNGGVNPIHHQTGPGGVAATGGLGGYGQPQKQQQPEKLHRSGSSSSSSSEDDGCGGRRKKGMKEKIKEKLPGQGGNQTQQGRTTPSDPGYVGSGGQYHEKKGVAEKVKEKLPGQERTDQPHQGQYKDQPHQGHKDQPHQGHTTTTQEGGDGGYVDSAGKYHEKKGVMEKIKEKLPGGGGGGAAAHH